jgi:hypothetical protein
VLDVAVRVVGTGSLGRFRYAALLSGKGEKVGKELVLELKEARPSSLEPSGLSEAQAVRVVRHERVLQGASPAYLGTTACFGLPFVVRELQPTEGKLEAAALKPTELDEVCGALGLVLGRGHRRVALDLEARTAGRGRAISRLMTAFALRYAELVCEDHARLVAGRGQLERQLGL